MFRFEDFKDEIFLVGGYRSGDKNQLDWIQLHKMYNIRATIHRHGYRDGIIDENVVSKNESDTLWRSGSVYVFHAYGIALYLGIKRGRRIS